MTRAAAWERKVLGSDRGALPHTGRPLLAISLNWHVAFVFTSLGFASGGGSTALFKMHIRSPYAPVPTSGPGALQHSIPVPHMSPFSPLSLSSSHPELFQLASVCYSPRFSLPLSLSPSLLVRVNHLL